MFTSKSLKAIASPAERRPIKVPTDSKIPNQILDKVSIAITRVTVFNVFPQKYRSL